jgi:hypothetical protein
MSANTTDRGVAPASNVDSSEKSADKTPAVTKVVELTIPPTASTTPTDAQDGATSNQAAGSDTPSPPM